MRTIKTLVALSLTVLATACATHVPPGAPVRDLSVITRDEVQKNHFQDAYEAVSRLHANWLHEHGKDSLFFPSQVLVYLDDMKLGGVDALRSINASAIGYVRHYDGLDATNRWGMNHGAGVIYVSTAERPEH